MVAMERVVVAGEGLATGAADWAEAGWAGAGRAKGEGCSSRGEKNQLRSASSPALTQTPAPPYNRMFASQPTDPRAACISHLPRARNGDRVARVRRSARVSHGVANDQRDVVRSGARKADRERLRVDLQHPTTPTST